MAANHREYANFIWDICNLLRGPYKRNEYRKVILPLTVLRRFDCLLEPTHEAVLEEAKKLDGKSETVKEHKLRAVTGRPFYNESQLTLSGTVLRASTDFEMAQNLNSYIQSFSQNIRTIMERFKFEQEIAKMADKGLLYQVVKAFCSPKIDLSADAVDNIQMGYIFEELIRIGAEQSNEEAGEHFTPREVIRLMVNLLLSPEEDLNKSHIVKTIYDPACGTGGMLSEAERYIRQLNTQASPLSFGQDWNDEAWAVCKSDMLIKGQEADNIILGDSFTQDAFRFDEQDRKITFDYMLANPPFGVEWKQQKDEITREHEQLGFDGRFGPGLPRVNDGALLFLLHMISKMRAPQDGGSRIAIVFNGSPLFTGDAGSGESDIRRWIIENDWLEAIVALPDQLFYNTGISTYIWILTNTKEARRKGKVQLIDARNFWIPMKKSMGQKRHKIGDPSDPQSPNDPDHIGEITRIHGRFSDGETREFELTDKKKGKQQKTLIVSKVFDNEDFGFQKITVERPLRLNFQLSEDRLVRQEEERTFQNLASSKKKDPEKKAAEIPAGKERQQEIRDLLTALQHATTNEGVPQLFRDRKAFLKQLKAVEKSRDCKLTATERKAVLSALGERDDEAEICLDSKGNPEADSDLRDTETVPLKEEIAEYVAREVLPHVPDAWVDESKTKIGYEIPLNRHFYRYEPPRELEEIESDIRSLESEILQLLEEMNA